MSADPKFVSSTDFHLQSGSPAIDSGFNLGSVVPTDFDGVVRPQGAGNDIGAYEFKSGQQPTRETLTLNSGNHGKIISPANSPAIVDFGTVQTISANGYPGYLFVKWTGDVATVANIYSATTTVIMKGNYTITANFVLGSYSIWIPLIRHR
ncbi:MAG TPA: choice-of-anchor Q domain-containing protein [Leptolinea sp.]